MVCDHAGYCHPYCEDYWGDCNDDYRDGCETRIKNRIYCDGDPRIGQYYPPHVVVLSERRTSGPGRYDAGAFDRELQAHHAELQHCYEALLEAVPTAEGELCYQFTIDEMGRVTRARVDPDGANSEAGAAVQLDACVSRFLGGVTYDARPSGGPAGFGYCISFSRGYFNTDDQP